MYLGCGRSLKKGNFVLESDRDVYAAIYMRHGVWYYSATGPGTGRKWEKENQRSG